MMINVTAEHLNVPKGLKISRKPLIRIDQDSYGAHPK